MQVGDTIKLSKLGLAYLTMVTEYYYLGQSSVGLIIKKHETKDAIFYDIYIEGKLIKRVPMFKHHFKEI